MKQEQGNYNPKRMRELNKMILMGKASKNREDTARSLWCRERTRGY